MVARVGVIEDLCAQHGIPLAAAALQFPVRHPVVEAVIPGIASPDELASAVTLAATPIPETFWKALAATLIDKRAA
ncbi:aldo/keto reductase [Novosphingobium resinovorum]